MMDERVGMVSAEGICVGCWWLLVGGFFGWRGVGSLVCGEDSYQAAYVYIIVVWVGGLGFHELRW